MLDSSLQPAPAFSSANEYANHERLDDHAYHEHSQPRGANSALPASWRGKVYRMEEGLKERDKATGTLTHWVKCNMFAVTLHLYLYPVCVVSDQSSRLLLVLQPS
ncbi:hypothetical protein EVAR_19164_1 [Eumeta japonica]|uniref:Uncharacterized protein n=1 Tax=Eumeta variegata TaxID=151549 RepID=A0A4C1VLV7_EUMVA|nr:hypothetical protein EVAR_19164_1 [Eumeta japonica]